MQRSCLGRRCWRLNGCKPNPNPNPMMVSTCPGKHGKLGKLPAYFLVMEQSYKIRRKTAFPGRVGTVRKAWIMQKVVLEGGVGG